ncbi:MAG: RNA polymerase factor sigma-54 [Chitinophagales bacterium]|nr:RNA polymerase factor sigma-54 [Bacteroidota bacterium]MCB9043884.1 RNA polymerase factor sigma-54 [Chitinophagales bacterium]
MLKQKLGQKLVQKLSPQQIQLMKLLQIPTTSLEQRIKEELEVNPALEEGETHAEEDDLFEAEARTDDANAEPDFSEYLDNVNILEDSYKLHTGRLRSQEEEEEQNRFLPIEVNESFHEYLSQQLYLLHLSDDDLKIARQLVGSIDDDGYIRRSLTAIEDDLAFTQGIEVPESELDRVLHIIQNRFEPSGVGARSLAECLILQLRRKQNGCNKYIDLAISILENNFEEFSKKHYAKLERALQIDEDELRLVLDEILKLNPKPGSGYSGGAQVEYYIIPDFIIFNDNGELKLTLNAKNAPDLRISSYYIDLMRAYERSREKDRKQREALMFIKQKIDAAKWFIDAIRQRQQTLYHTMKAILDYQYAYFFTGDQTRLKPMILKDISDITGLDISTISRVVNSKYVQTEYGTFKLKSFFSESLSTEAGDEVSTLEVKEILQNLISKENKRKPLSDQKLTESLLKRGYNIARRTVAKYREQLNFPVARLRKEL